MLRDPAGHFTANPSSETTLEPGHMLIAVGTADQPAALRAAVLGRVGAR